MLNRIASFFGTSTRDVVLFTVATLLLLAFGAVWAPFLVPLIGEQVINKYVLTLIILAFAFAVAAIPMLIGGWGRAERKPRASFMVRLGLALQIFGLVFTPIGLLYATDPQRSVPVAFASFTAVFLGIFVAGFGGNMIAPPRA